MFLPPPIPYDAEEMRMPRLMVYALILLTAAVFIILVG